MFTVVKTQVSNGSECLQTNILRQSGGQERRQCRYNTTLGSNVPIRFYVEQPGGGGGGGGGGRGGGEV